MFYVIEKNGVKEDIKIQIDNLTKLLCVVGKSIDRDTFLYLLGPFNCSCLYLIK